VTEEREEGIGCWCLDWVEVEFLAEEEGSAGCEKGWEGSMEEGWREKGGGKVEGLEGSECWGKGARGIGCWR
jgi:hypothetical protein